MENLLRFRRHQRKLHIRGRRLNQLLNVICGILVLLIVVTLAFWFLSAAPSAVAKALSFLNDDAAPCLIKGEITVADKRLYHVPGSRHYEQVSIATHRGEKWFCSVDEALQAGWRPYRP